MENSRLAAARKRVKNFQLITYTRTTALATPPTATPLPACQVPPSLACYQWVYQFKFDFIVRNSTRVVASLSVPLSFPLSLTFSLSFFRVPSLSPSIAATNLLADADCGATMWYINQLALRGQERKGNSKRKKERKREREGQPIPSRKRANTSLIVILDT